MSKKTIEFESMHFDFEIEKNVWTLNLAKSQTNIKDLSQLALITNHSDFFVPADVKDEDDEFVFTFTIDAEKKTWHDLKELGRNDKLRLLKNIARFKECLSTRMTFFLHPENLLFDDNLVPTIIHRGIRDLLPPYSIDPSKYLHQYKCLAVALFSKKYSFDELYNGSLANAKDTEFERKISEMSEIADLLQFLEDSYRQEQKTTDRQMQFVPKKRFRLFKQLSITMIAIAVLLAAPLIYFVFVKNPYQETLLAAHQDFLASDYNGVIGSLEKKNAEKLPNQTKYILAYSYVDTEVLKDEQKASIKKNISLKSDSSYLLYWIYNGRGDLEKSTDLAKYMDDPVLLIYGLIKQIEQVKNDPALTGGEREEQVKALNEQLESYQEQYELLPTEELTSPDEPKEAPVEKPVEVEVEPKPEAETEDAPEPVEE